MAISVAILDHGRVEGDRKRERSRMGETSSRRREISKGRATVVCETRRRVTPYAFGSRATAETQLAPLLGREKSRPARRRNGSEKLPPFDTATFFKLESFGDEYRDSLIREIAHLFFKEKERDEEEKNTTKNRRG